MRITENLLQKTFANVCDSYGLKTIDDVQRSDKDGEFFTDDHYKLDYDGGIYGYEIVIVRKERLTEPTPRWYCGERLPAREMYRYLQAMLRVKHFPPNQND